MTRHRKQMMTGLYIKVTGCDLEATSWESGMQLTTAEDQTRGGGSRNEGTRVITTLWASRVCYRDSLTFTLKIS
jgi:hypothetical protein